jgi:hypothetical protein
MPLYSFRTPQGRVVERFYHMRDAPPIGSKRGQLVRVPDGNQAKCVKDRHFVSKSLPLNYKHHRDAGGKFNKKGQPIFESMRQVQQTAARSRGEEGGAEGMGYIYD